MALFGKKKKTEEEVKKAETAPIAAASAPAVRATSSRSSKKHAGTVLYAPRITEKSTDLAQLNAYVFNVHKGANKRDIAEAVRTTFNVTPTKVRIVPTLGKNIVTRTGGRGKSASGKKAYVYLKKGETIEIS